MDLFCEEQLVMVRETVVLVWRVWGFGRRVAKRGGKGRPCWWLCGLNNLSIWFGGRKG